MSDSEQDTPLLIPPTGTAFFLRVSTGCTCCSYENFIEGPYRTREAAQVSADDHKQSKTLSSQYAENGNHSIFELDYEIAGRWIIFDGKYATPDGFIEDAEGYIDRELECFKKHFQL